jgi:hypothetical protein
VRDDLHPRARSSCSETPARTGRDPSADLSPASSPRAGRTFWLQSRSRACTELGDSVIAAYERYCEAYECWTTSQLEEFVKALTRPDR